MTEILVLSNFTLPLSNASNYTGAVEAICCLATACFSPGNKRNFGAPLIRKLTCAYLFFSFSKDLFSNSVKENCANCLFWLDVFVV